MPEISRFHGIIAFINYREHLPPHFHAKYQDQEVTVEIQTGIVEGRMSRRPLRLVLEWYEMHRKELQENWDRAMDQKALLRIDPLM